MFEYHCRQGAAATVGLFEREVKIDFGVVDADREGRLVGYREKPVFKFKVSMGVNVLNPKVVQPYLTPGKYLDLPELIMCLRNDGHLVCCYSEPCYWLDIGRVDDYEKANDIFASRYDEFIPKDVPE
jgi:NDP-sugar pyrophosphorylase family protein